MHGALEYRLRQIASPAPQDLEIVRAWEARLPRIIRAKRDMVRQSDVPTHMRLILSGWACRYFQLPDGRRQILSILMPGDLSGLSASLLGQHDHAIATISDCKVVEIPARDFLAAIEARDSLRRAIMISRSVELAVQRQHCVSMGQRNAFERISHLFCETLVRARAAGIARDDGCEFPLTQADIADATGLTAVHVNRTIQLLRKEGLVTLTSRRLVVPDLQRLARAALFDPIEIAASDDDGTIFPEPAQRAFNPDVLQLA